MGLDLGSVSQIKVLGSLRVDLELRAKSGSGWDPVKQFSRPVSSLLSAESYC